ncbi:hypothetical protein PG991_008371 [Apiospora marii]|uniref:Uncharacterized protein n=1 Tax=Apiospora marii TaxID=335849 RepID=A0ABR1RMN9_9PEZI
MQHPDVERPPTPEERSHRVDTANPTDPMPKYEVGNEVWFRPSTREAFGEFKIAAVKKEDDAFWYQITENGGALYKKGEWVPQVKVKKAEGK